MFYVCFFVQFFEPSRCTLYLVLCVNYLSFLVGLTKKSERQSFKEYWNDYQEWLKGDKLSRLAKRGK